VRYEAVLFDFDGVIVDSEPVHYECWRETLAPFGIDLPWDLYHREFIGVSDRRLVEAMAELAPAPVDPDTLFAQYPAKKDRFRARMMDAPPISRGAADLLPALSGFRLGLVTSSGRSEVEPILQACGLRGHFEVAVFGEDVSRHKPDPEPYRKAADLLGVTRALVVEDSEAGLASGRAAGFDVLRIPDPHEMAALVRRRLSL
jgi:beta-phosphoglucomutase